MKKIITISREFGSGGGEIGEKVAKRLGFELYDKSIILQAARSANIDPGEMLKHDERVPQLIGFTQSLFDMYNSPLDERLFEAQKSVIKKIGEHGNCVIVGRNANSILQEYDDSLHVFIHADKYWRIMRMKQNKMKDYSEEKISQHMRDVDKTRRKYCSYYTDTEFGVAEFYDLCLSTSSLGIDTCVDIICDLANK